MTPGSVRRVGLPTIAVFQPLPSLQLCPNPVNADNLRLLNPSDKVVVLYDARLFRVPVLPTRGGGFAVSHQSKKRIQNYSKKEFRR